MKKTTRQDAYGLPASEDVFAATTFSRLRCTQKANIFIATFVRASVHAVICTYVYVCMQTYALMLELQIVTKDLPTKVWQCRWSMRKKW